MVVGIPVSLVGAYLVAADLNNKIPIIALVTLALAGLAYVFGLFINFALFFQF